ncbi:hypothetical protein FJR38_02890 [Anabaena sp. UHCC 0253]|nr:MULTISPECIES: hypothetical protein [unclassified Anabaena]MTJ07793.1 hypothetical protein [Anabaena sp. UHCC 0204]MTJ51700.1 hypothetical protein [Anabaena sp. UHCC 0253]
MATKRPRTTISFDSDEYVALEKWAKSEFRSVPQLVSVIIKKALIEKNLSETQAHSSQVNLSDFQPENKTNEHSTSR